MAPEIHRLRKKKICIDQINEAMIKLDFESTGKNRRRKFIYRSSTPCFNFFVFVEQFVKHLFFPVANILMYRKYVGYGLFYKELYDGGISVAEVAISALTGVAWRMVVASKYASMSAKEYLEFLTCEDRDMVDEIQNQMQLVTGWTSVDIPFCVHESNLALGRMGFYPENHAAPPYFVISRRDLPSWGNMLGQDAAQLLAKGGEQSADIPVSVADLMALIVDSSQPKRANRAAFVIVILMTLLFSLIPGLVRVSCSSLSNVVVSVDDNVLLCRSTSFFADGGVAPSFFSALVMFHTFMPMFALNLFFASAFSGSMRHYYSSNILSDIVRIDTESKSLHESPVLDLQNPNNIRAWVRARLTLHYFGKRYIQRIDLYTKMCAVILVLLVGWVYIHSKAMPDNQGQPNRLLVDVRYWAACYLIVVWGFGFLVIISVMAATNFELVHQEIEFLLHRLTVREDNSEQPRATTLPAVQEEAPNSLTRSESIESEVFSDSPREVKTEWYEAIFGEPAEPSDTWIEMNTSNKDSPSPTASPPSSPSSPHSSPITRSDMALKERVMSGLELASDEAKFEELDDLLDTVVLIVEAQSRIDPRRFLGADISWNVVISFLVAWASVIGLTLSVAGMDYSLG